MDSRENRDKELWELYNKLDSDEIPAGYEWPNFIECDKKLSGGEISWLPSRWH